MSKIRFDVPEKQRLIDEYSIDTLADSVVVCHEEIKRLMIELSDLTDDRDHWKAEAEKAGVERDVAIRELSEFASKAGKVAAGLTALAEKYRKERDELMEMIRIIPCSCHEAFKCRNLTDPDCPRCNWIYDDLITHIQEADGDMPKM